MNIFAISASPSECAAALDDKRVIKMALETAQMLCTSLYLHGYTETPYKPTHMHHPCTRWAAEKMSHWEWLLTYLGKLNSKYKERFRKECNLKAYTVVMEHDLITVAKKLLPVGPMSDFHNSSGFPDLPVFEAYKESLTKKWLQDKRRPKWTNDEPPLWIDPSYRDLFCNPASLTQY